MLLVQFLLLSSVLFCIGVYGVLARRNGVLVLNSSGGLFGPSSWAKIVKTATPLAS